MVDDRTDAYERGVVAGKISVRLDHHDEQLVVMGATLAKVVTVEADLTLAVQELAGEAKASRETAQALALALKDARETAKGVADADEAKVNAAQKVAADKAALGYSPITKLYAFAAFVFGLIAVYVLLKPGGS